MGFEYVLDMIDNATDDLQEFINICIDFNREKDDGENLKYYRKGKINATRKCLKYIETIRTALVKAMEGDERND